MVHIFPALLEKLGLTTGRAKSALQTAVSMTQDGIAIAQILRHADNLPQLRTCLFHATDSHDEQLNKLIELSTTYNFNKGSCFTLLDNDQISLLMVEAPAVEPGELRAAVRWQIKDLISFHIDDAVIDLFDIPEHKDHGRQKMMYVVVSRISAIQEHIDNFEKNAIDLAVIDIAELAQRNIASLLPEESGGIALLSIGQQTTLLTISRGKSLYLTRRIDVGLQRMMQLLNTDADQSSDEFVLDDDDIPPLEVYGVLDSITLEIQRSLDYYESNFSMPPVSGVVLAPMEEVIPGIISYLSSTLGTAVRQLDLNPLLEIEGTMSDRLQAHCLHAIGLALREESIAL